MQTAESTLQITMTWADGVLALALGIVGSMLAAFFYKLLPSTFERVARQWAKRSERAAEKRLQKLSERLIEVEAFMKNSTRFSGWLGQKLGDMIYKSTATVIFSVLGTYLLTKPSFMDRGVATLSLGIAATSL